MGKQVELFGRILEISDERMVDIMVHREVKLIAEETVKDVKNVFAKHKTIEDLMNHKNFVSFLFALVYTKCEDFLQANGISIIEGSEIQEMAHRNLRPYFSETFEKMENEYRRILIFEDNNKDSKLRKLYKDSTLRKELEQAAYMEVYDLIPIIQHLLKKKGIANDPITIKAEQEGAGLFKYLQENRLEKYQAYEIAYQLFCSDPTEPEYYDWCILNFPEEISNLVKLERVVGYEPSREVLEGGLRALFNYMPHNTEDQTIVLKERLEKIRAEIGIKESDTINRVDKLLYQFDLEARTFQNIEFPSRELKKRAEADYREIAGYCKEIERISESECETYRNFINSKSYIPEIAAIFINQIDERKKTIWKQEDAEQLDKIFMDTDINNQESVHKSISAIEDIGRTDDKDNYINALKGMDEENKKLFRNYHEWQNKKFMEKYLLQVILFSVGIVGMILGIGVIVLVVAVIVTLIKARKIKKMKEVWELLSLKGRLLHPQLLKYEKMENNRITSATQKENFIVCDSCGKEINPTAQFCKFCGSKISK